MNAVGVGVPGSVAHTWDRRHSTSVPHATHTLLSSGRKACREEGSASPVTFTLASNLCNSTVNGYLAALFA